MAIHPSTPTRIVLPEAQTGAFEDVPALFRAILTLVADAERAGLRHDAERARADAIEAYASGWDDAGRRRLERIAERISRRLAPQRSRRFFRLA